MRLQYVVETRDAYVAGLAALVLLAGCRGGDEAATTQGESALSIAEATANEPPEPEPVKGYVVYLQNREARLCSGLRESSPPQCVEPSLRIDGPEISSFGFDTTLQDGNVWTDEEVVLIGLVRDGDLRIEEPD